MALIMNEFIVAIVEPIALLCSLPGFFGWIFIFIYSIGLIMIIGNIVKFIIHPVKCIKECFTRPYKPKLTPEMIYYNETFHDCAEHYECP